MSLPLGVITAASVISAFRPPYDRAYSPLRQYVLGGSAIGNGAAGRDVQVWIVSYDGTSINVFPDGGTIVFSLAVAEVLSVSLAFDANMQPAIAYTTISGAFLYYYDIVASAFATLTVAGGSSCRTCVDDPRLFNGANSDVIFAYTLSGQLFYRQQRDKYTIAYLVGIAPGLLVRMAPNLANRLQFQLNPS